MMQPIPDQSKKLSSRRSFLSAAAISTIGLGMSTSISSAFLFRRSTPIDLSSLPQTWLRLQGESTVESYADYLTSLRLKYVTPMQVLKAHAKTKGSLWNSIPPRSMWTSMGGTLKTVDRLGARLGQPVKEVTSAYRSPAYNRRCAGAGSQSWHMRNYAVDLKFNLPTSTVASAARGLRAQGIFQGGVGRYPTFVHVDTRGQNIDW